MKPKNEPYKGYQRIPGFSRYVVNREWDIINTITGRHISYAHTPSGYYICSLIDDHGRRRGIFRSRVMCMTFKPTEMANFLQVDHVNCNKEDDRLENLEWVTSKENCQRASRNGLYKGAHPVMVRDYDTKVVTTYESMAAAARALGMNKEQIQYRLELNDGRVYPERKQYCFVDKFTNWADVEDVECEIERYGVSKRVLVRHVLDGYVKEFDRISDAAKALNLSVPYLSTALSSKVHPVLPGLFQAKLKSDPRPWRDPVDPLSELDSSGKGTVIVAINDAKKLKEVYVRQADCAARHHILVNTLNYRIKHSKPGTVFSNGFRYSYYSDNEEGPTTSDYHVEYFT